MPTFAVLAHDEPAQLARLCGRLAPYPVVVHVDARSPLEPFESALRPLGDRVTLVGRERVAVRWGGYSIIDATLAAYRLALPLTARADHVVLLSGRCYPVRPVSAFAADLAAGPRPQRIRAYDLRTAPPRFLDKVRRRWFFDLPGTPPLDRAPVQAQRLVRKAAAVAARPFPQRLPPVTLAGGSQWVALTRACLEDVLPGEPELRRTFAHSLAPDELVLHSLVHGSRWGAETPAGGLEPFPAAALHARQGLEDGLASLPNYHLIHPSLAKVYAADDLDLVTGSTAFFVRKVSAASSAGLLDRLDVLAGETERDAVSG